MFSPVVVLQAGFCPAFTLSTNGETGIRQRGGEILFLGSFISGGGFSLGEAVVLILSVC